MDFNFPTMAEVTSEKISKKDGKKLRWILKIYSRIIAAESYGHKDIFVVLPKEDVGFVKSLATFFNDKGFRATAGRLKYLKENSLYILIKWGSY